MSFDIEGFELDVREKVGCYFCMQNSVYTDYIRGEAYLVDAGHPPCDGNANYVCKEHLNPETVIYDVTDT